MLTSLHIENIAVIESADIELGSGFNVLTGETGAGKSIVIDSIDAVLGGRTSREIVRHGADKALVSAVFTDDGTQPWLQENEVESEGELILQRRITTDGKSSCRVNGVPVTVQQLRALGSLLLDIHGQNDGRQLLDESRHLEYLDAFGGLHDCRGAFSEEYGKYCAVLKEIDRLSMDEVEKERLSESLKYQISELEGAKLASGEEDELTARRDLMKNSEKLTEALEEAYGAIYGLDDCAVSLVSDAENRISRVTGFAASLEETAKELGDARFMLEDAAERINELRLSLDFSSEEFDSVERRLSLLRRLSRKYSLDESGMLEHLEKCRTQLDEMEYAGDRIVKLQKELEKCRKAVLSAGAELTKKRREAAKTLSERIESELKYLNMPSVRFVADIQPCGGEKGFDSKGCDEVRFLMSANAGEEPGRISRIASGGELSRIMLAMKSAFAENDAVGSFVFDEIDTGVSGIAAQRVGEKMGALSKHKQIICITHLPQIAAMADRHFSIIKQERDGRTFTSVTELDREGRVRELARLHGGDVITATTLKSAEEQLAAAESFKSGV